MIQTNNSEKVTPENVMNVLSDMHIRAMRDVLNDLHRAYASLCNKALCDLTPSENIVIDLWQKFVTKVTVNEDGITYVTAYGEYLIPFEEKWRAEKCSSHSMQELASKNRP